MVLYLDFLIQKTHHNHQSYQYRSKSRFQAHFQLYRSSFWVFVNLKCIYLSYTSSSNCIEFYFWHFFHSIVSLCWMSHGAGETFLRYVDFHEDSEIIYSSHCYHHLSLLAQFRFQLDGQVFLWRSVFQGIKFDHREFEKFLILR